MAPIVAAPATIPRFRNDRRFLEAVKTFPFSFIPISFSQFEFRNDSYGLPSVANRRSPDGNRPTQSQTNGSGPEAKPRRSDHTNCGPWRFIPFQIKSDVMFLSPKGHRPISAIVTRCVLRQEPTTKRAAIIAPPARLSTSCAILLWQADAQSSVYRLHLR